MPKQKDSLNIFKGSLNEVRSVEYTTADNRLLLIPLGDVHLGSPTCDIDKFVKTMAFIKATDCKIILMGDLLEAASKSSVGSGWVEQTASPQDQLDALKEVFKPIKDKILLVLDGNHEERIWKNSGISVSKVLADHLGAPYGGYSAFVYIRVGKQNYVVHAQHGSTGARYLRTKMHAAMKTAEHTDADLYLYGHTHELASAVQPYRRYDKRGRYVGMKKKRFVLTGGFLNYFGGYAERKNMNPSPIGVANIKLYGDHFDIHVST